ncbi:MAG: hypothetical protein J07HX64_02338 [halophilic archaeon J07HX64]|nr:MAG: hypothetical protein J07HX64_02338 [halophilic archaeon J07HX64]
MIIADDTAGGVRTGHHRIGIVLADESTDKYGTGNTPGRVRPSHIRSLHGAL